jgi:hypothetical protein
MDFLESGTFRVGCNYWASHAGTNMWKDWRPDVVEADFARLASHNIRLVRVFPLWPDFQPVEALYGNSGLMREYRMGEEPLPDTPLGQAGVSEEAMEKFAQLCALSKKYGLQLIVGLITGWMSGRLYVPPALSGKNIIQDPVAIMWQVRYVRSFVRYFQQEPAILAWDLGNECNCLAQFDTMEQLYLWSASIAGAIRMEDSSRPIISGMHGLLPEGKWDIRQQAEMTDMLTTHPYPLFTPWCDAAPINTLRTELHGTAESLFYRGIGKKPCFVEETGTLGPMMGDEETAGAFARACLYSLWAHDCRAYLWWCANEQINLTFAPYDWCVIERELGLFRTDHSPKPVIQEMEDFSHFVENFKPGKLPPRLVDGVCVLTHGQDSWANAYMSFVLAKQAGLDLEFAYSDQQLPDAPLYLMPGVCGDSAISAHRMKELLVKVEQGACLYISLDDGLLSGFESLFGAKSKGRARSGAEQEIRFAEDEGGFTLTLQTPFRIMLEAETAAVFAWDGEGNPVGLCHPYGKGYLVLLTAPLERTVAQRQGRMEEATGYYRVYRYLKQFVASEKVAQVNWPNVGLTEHPVDENRRILVLVNYDPEQAEVVLHLRDGWKAGTFLKGSLAIPGNDCTVMEICTA